MLHKNVAENVCVIQEKGSLSVGSLLQFQTGKLHKAGMSTIGHCGGFKSFDVCIHMPIHIYNIHIHIHTYIHYTLYIPLAVAPVRL